MPRIFPLRALVAALSIAPFVNCDARDGPRGPASGVRTFGLSDLSSPRGT